MTRAEVSPLVEDAQRRLVRAVGMPFPIAEDRQGWAAGVFAAGAPREDTVPLSLLTATQRDLSPDKVIDMLGSGEDLGPIDVVRHMCRYLIVDGHHRAVAARCRGDGMVRANVVEANGERSQRG